MLAPDAKVPSNYWRAREVIRAVADRGAPEAAELGSNARTTRFCVIWVVVTGGPVGGPITYWILHIR